MVTWSLFSTAILALLSANTALSTPVRVNVQVFKRTNLFKRQACNTAIGESYCNKICCKASQQCGSWDNSQCNARSTPDNQNGEWRTWTSAVVQTVTNENVVVVTVISTYSEWVPQPAATGSIAVAPAGSSVVPTFTYGATGVYSQPVRPTQEGTGGAVVAPTITNTGDFTFPVPTGAAGNSGLGYGGVIGGDSGGSGLTSAQIGGIVGGVIGAIALILLLLLCCCLRKGYSGLVGLFKGRRHGSYSSESSHSGYGQHHSAVGTAAKAGVLGLLLGSFFKRKNKTSHSAYGGVATSHSGSGSGHGRGGFAALAGAAAAGLTSMFMSRRKSEKSSTGHGYVGVGAGGHYGSEKYSSGTSYSSYTETGTSDVSTSTGGTRSTSGSSSGSSSSSGSGSSSGSSGSSSSGGSGSSSSSSSR